MQSEISQLDSKYDNGALSTLLLAAAFDGTLPKETRIFSAIAAKRLAFAPNVPKGAEILNLNEEAKSTFVHCLGLYDVNEANCDHFGAVPPTEADVERLSRLIESSDVYVVLKNVKEYTANEERLDAAQAYPVLSDVPEDPQAGVFDRLSPAPTPQEDAQGATPGFSDRAHAALASLEKVADLKGIPRDEALSQLAQARSFMGEVIALAHTR